MASAVKTIRDALVTALNGQTFSQSFTAVGVFDAFTDSEDIDGLTVTVHPEGRANVSRSRDYSVVDYTMAITIQKEVSEVPATRETEVDELIELAIEVENWVSMNEDIVRFDDAFEFSPYSVNLLRDQSLFYSASLPVYQVAEGVE